MINTIVELNEANQEDADAWQNLSGSIRDAKINIVNDLKEIVSQASDAVDEIQNVYDVLKDVANEYAENDGFITVDSFQKIVELGPQYMQYLRDENGLLVINEENINRVIAAKTQQLALENAMAYVERLRLALNNQSLEDLNNLLYATTEGTNATWGLVYANLALLNLNGDQYQAALHNINAIRALADNAVMGIGQVAGKAFDELNDMKDGLDGILEYVMDMLKQRIEDEIDSLEDMKDAYADIIALRKESLETAQEEGKYQDEVASKIKKMAKLQERINALSLDDSRDAQAEKIKLEEEMAALQKELADTQSDHAIDAQEDSLDKMQEAYEAEKDKEIDILEKTISSHQKLYDIAISYIGDNWDTLYGELIDWNTEYGSVLNSEITTAWDNCLAAAQKYGDYVSAMNRIDADIDSANGSSGSSNNILSNTSTGASFSNTDAIRTIVNQMKRNSAQWMSASTSRRNELDADNMGLASDLEGYGVSVHRGADGVWYLQDGRKLYSVYHKGGIVGDRPTLKQNEALALLENGEAVLDDKKQNRLFELIELLNLLTKKAGQFSVDGSVQRLTQTMLAGFDALRSSTLDATQRTSNAIIQMGDVYIYGADESTVEQHREINRQFANEVLQQMNIKR